MEVGVDPQVEVGAALSQGGGDMPPPPAPSGKSILWEDTVLLEESQAQSRDEAEWTDVR